MNISVSILLTLLMVADHVGLYFFTSAKYTWKALPHGPQEPSVGNIHKKKTESYLSIRSDDFKN